MQRWQETLEGGVELQEVTPDDSFAFLVRSVGLPRHRSLGHFLRGKRVLVLTAPMLLRFAEEEMFAGGCTPRVRSIYKATRRRPDAYTEDIDVLLIDVTFGTQTVLFYRAKEIIAAFDGPVITMGHFQINSLQKPPREAAAALLLQGRPPAKLVWFPPVNPQLLRDAFEKLPFSADIARKIGAGGHRA